MAMHEAQVAGGQVDTRHWIGGRRVGSASTFTDVPPIAEQSLAEIASGGRAEVCAAVEAAQTAFPGWARTPASERAAVLHAIADGIERHAEERRSGSTASSCVTCVPPSAAPDSPG